MIDCTYDSAGADMERYSCPGGVRSSERRPLSLASLDDVDLVDRAVGTHHEAPDPEAFGELYERYVNAVYAFALSRLHNPADAEDITSQTFLQALQALPRYQHRGVPLLKWLFRITYNLIAGLHRASAATVGPLRILVRQDLPGGQQALDPPDPDAAAAITAWEATEEFGRMLHVVTSEQRTVLRLRFGDDMAVAAVALKTGHSMGAVKALQSRATRELRRRLEHADWNTLALDSQGGQRRNTGSAGAQIANRRTLAHSLAR